MKKQIFTLIMMLALVVVAGSAFGQSSPRNPFQGSTETYSVSLGASYEYEFLVTQSSVVKPPASWTADTTAAGAAFTWASTPTGTSASPTVDIKWDVSSGAYNLWIRAKTANDCYSYRFVQINPNPNIWDVQIFALAVADTTTLPSNPLTAIIAQNNADSTAHCAVIEDATSQYLDTTGVSPAVNDGATWIYYRVERSNGTDDNDWTFYLNLTADNDGNMQGSYDFSTWSDVTEGAVLVDVSTAGMTDKNVYFVRAKYNASTTSRNIRAIIDQTSSPFEATSLLTDSDATTNDVLITLNPIPDMGTGFDGF